MSKGCGAARPPASPAPGWTETAPLSPPCECLPSSLVCFPPTAVIFPSCVPWTLTLLFTSWRPLEQLAPNPGLELSCCRRRAASPSGHVTISPKCCSGVLQLSHHWSGPPPLPSPGPGQLGLGLPEASQAISSPPQPAHRPPAKGSPSLGPP